MAPESTAGRYVMTLSTDGNTIFHGPVIVHIVGHPLERAPFFALQVDDVDLVAASLRPHEGKRVEVAFARRVDGKR